MSVSAMVAGVSATATPAALRTSIFPAAVPLPPETMAPAWPIRRPGGAVTPAMKAATGFRQLSLIQEAASSSAEPPISPIRIIASVPESALKILTASRCDMPLIASRLGDGIEHGDFIVEHLSTFSRRHARDDIRPVLHALPGVKGTGAASDSLDNEACVFIDQNGHDWNDE